MSFFSFQYKIFLIITGQISWFKKYIAFLIFLFAQPYHIPWVRQISLHFLQWKLCKFNIKKADTQRLVPAASGGIWSFQVMSIKPTSAVSYNDVKQPVTLTNTRTRNASWLGAVCLQHGRPVVFFMTNPYRHRLDIHLSRSNCLLLCSPAQSFPMCMIHLLKWRLNTTKLWW